MRIALNSNEHEKKNFVFHIVVLIKSRKDVEKYTADYYADYKSRAFPTDN